MRFSLLVLFICVGFQLIKTTKALERATCTDVEVIFTKPEEFSES